MPYGTLGLERVKLHVEVTKHAFYYKGKLFLILLLLSTLGTRKKCPLKRGVHLKEVKNVVFVCS